MHQRYYVGLNPTSLYAAKTANTQLNKLDNVYCILLFTSIFLLFFVCLFFLFINVIILVAAAISSKLILLNDGKNFTEKEPAYILFEMNYFKLN